MKKARTRRALGLGVDEEPSGLGRQRRLGRWRLQRAMLFSGQVDVTALGQHVDRDGRKDDETNEVAYTKVSCKLLDCKTGHCSDYPNRIEHVPDCIQLTPEKLENIHWLPSSCAYQRMSEGKSLPSWHYLNTGTRESVIKARKSVAGRCVSEADVDEDEIEDYIVRWVR